MCYFIGCYIKGHPASECCLLDRNPASGLVWRWAHFGAAPCLETQAELVGCGCVVQAIIWATSWLVPASTYDFLRGGPGARLLASVQMLLTCGFDMTAPLIPEGATVRASVYVIGVLPPSHRLPPSRSGTVFPSMQAVRA